MYSIKLLIIFQLLIFFFTKNFCRFAQKLNLKNTAFSNPHGLCDKGNKSCAIDLGKLSYYFMQQEFLKKVVNSKSFLV